MLPASPIGLSLPPQTRRGLFRAFGLYMIQHPGDNAAAHIPQEGAEFPLKGRHVLGCRFVVEEVLNEPSALRQRARQLPNQWLEGGCQQDFGRCRMDHRGG